MHGSALNLQLVAAVLGLAEFGDLSTRRCYLCPDSVENEGLPVPVANIGYNRDRTTHPICDRCFSLKLTADYRKFINAYLRLILAEGQRKAMIEWLLIRKLEGKGRHPKAKVWAKKIMLGVEAAQAEMDLYKDKRFHCDFFIKAA